MPGPWDPLDGQQVGLGLWSAFYHLMSKANWEVMNRAGIERTVRKCAKLVGETFRFFYRVDGKIKSKMLGSSSGKDVSFVLPKQ
jgi:hypothetical protein